MVILKVLKVLEEITLTGDLIKKQLKIKEMRLVIVTTQIMN